MEHNILQKVVAARRNFDKYVELENQAKACRGKDQAEMLSQQAEMARVRVQSQYVYLAKQQGISLPKAISADDSDMLEQIEKVSVRKSIPQWLNSRYKPIWKQLDTVLGKIPKLIGPLLRSHQRMGILFHWDKNLDSGWKPYNAWLEKKAWQETAEETDSLFEFVQPHGLETSEDPFRQDEPVAGQDLSVQGKEGKPEIAQGRFIESGNVGAGSKPALGSKPVPAPGRFIKSGNAGAGSKPALGLKPGPTMTDVQSGSTIVDAESLPFRILPVKKGSRMGMLYDHNGEFFEWLNSPARDNPKYDEKLGRLKQAMIHRQIEHIQMVIGSPKMEESWRSLVSKPEIGTKKIFTPKTILMQPRDFQEWVHQQSNRIPVFPEPPAPVSPDLPKPLQGLAMPGGAAGKLDTGVQSDYSPEYIASAEHRPGQSWGSDIPISPQLSSLRLRSGQAGRTGQTEQTEGVFSKAGMKGVPSSTEPEIIFLKSTPDQIAMFPEYSPSISSHSLPLSSAGQGEGLKAYSYPEAHTGFKVLPKALPDDLLISSGPESIPAFQGRPESSSIPEFINLAWAPYMKTMQAYPPGKNTISGLGKEIRTAPANDGEANRLKPQNVFMMNLQPVGGMEKLIPGEAGAPPPLASPGLPALPGERLPGVSAGYNKSAGSKNPLAALTFLTARSRYAPAASRELPDENDAGRRILPRPEPEARMAAADRDEAAMPLPDEPRSERTVAGLAKEFYRWFMGRKKLNNEQQYGGENRWR